MLRSVLDHFIVCASTLGVEIMFTAIAPLFPLELERRQMSSVYSGVMMWQPWNHFSFMSTFYFLGPFAFKPFVRRCGKLPLALAATLVQAVSVGCFGLARLVTSNELFFTISLAARIVIGFCSITSVMTIMLMATTYFERTRTYMSICFLGIQLADAGAPLWTGLLFDSLGYVGSFLTLGLFPLMAGLLLCPFRSYEQSHPYVEIRIEKTLSYSQILRVPGVFFGLLSFVASESFYMTIDPILPFKLSREFGYDQHQIGMFFFYFTIVVISASFLMLCVPQRANKVLIILVGSFLLPVGTFLTGPSHLLSLPDDTDLMIAGMAVAGVGKSLIQSFFSAFMIESACRAYPDKVEQVRERIPPMLSLSFGVAIVVVPLLMSLAYKALNFKIALDILGGYYLANAVVFLVYSMKINWGREGKENRSISDAEESLLDKKLGSI